MHVRSHKRIVQVWQPAILSHVSNVSLIPEQSVSNAEHCPRQSCVHLILADWEVEHTSVSAFKVAGL